MLRITSLVIAALLMGQLVAVGPAFAISLDDAKHQGWVGETASGYLEAVPPQPPPEAKALVAEINEKRRAAYQRIAAKNGSPLEAVEQIGGKEAIEKAPAGTFVKLPGQGWKRK